jgi:phospholipid transport system substrate-binding protein
MFRSKIFCLCFLFILCPHGPAFANPDSQAQLVVKGLNTALLAVMQDAERLGYQGRYEKLAGVIESTHDLEYIARFSVGKKNWKAINDNGQKKFVDAFSEYCIAAYSSRFDGYAGEGFRVTGAQPAKRGRIQVNSVLEIPGEEAVDFVYLLQPGEEKPRIVNIIVGGVSDLALKRAEFKTIIANEGFAALLQYLEMKTQGYADGDE